MSEALIDEFDSLDKGKKKNWANIKIVSRVLGVFFLVFGFLCFAQIFELFSSYFKLRHKELAWFSLNALVIAICLSILPIMTSNVLTRSNRKITLTNYLMLLVIMILFYIFFLVLGLELIFVLPKPVDSNPFLPSYIFIPPFPYCFDLLFIISATMSFLILKLVFRKKNGKSMK